MGREVNLRPRGSLEPAAVSRRLLTFLFTDLVGSTELWERLPDSMGLALSNHERIVGSAIDEHGGTVFKHTGDGFAAVFDSASDAARAALAIQVGLADKDQADGGLDVRIGVNSGEAEERGGDYFGGAVNLAARVMGAGDAGHVLLTESTAAVVRATVIPHVELRDLGEHWLRGFQRPIRLFQLEHPSLAAPPLELSRPAPAEAYLLPVPNDKLIGRRAELVGMAELLEQHPVVTLVGPAGVGKSRLALELARRVGPEFPDGMVWCDLVTTGPRPEDVASTVAAALGVPDPHPSYAEAVVEWLRHRRLALVLDTCEHVIDGVHEMVAQIVGRCPRVSVIATSREAVQVVGEAVVPVQPFGSGSAAADAVRLFVERARSVGAALDDDADTTESIERICRRLDGLPLAIELAASRARSMTLAEIESALQERFSLLVRRRPLAGSHERHLSLESTVRFSYDLLAPDEQRLFEIMGLFTGGCDQRALRSVVERVDDLPDDPSLLVWELVEKSMVTSDTRGARARFTMLDTLRDFARARLAERSDAERLRRLHAEYFHAFAERAEIGRGTAEERVWVEAQLVEFQNLRTAVGHGLSVGDLDLALGIYVALYELALFQGRTEIFSWLDPVSLAGGQHHELLPAALAMSSLRQDPFHPVSLTTAEQALELHERRGGREHRILLFARGFAEASRQNSAAALDAYRGTVEVVEATEGRNGRWINARSLAMVDRSIGAARDLVDDAREVGQPTGQAFALLALARALAHEDPAAALSVTEEARQLARDVSNVHALMYVDLVAARIVARGVDASVALAHLIGALEAAVKIREHEAIWRTVDELHGMLHRTGHEGLATELITPWLVRFPGRVPSQGSMGGGRPGDGSSTPWSLIELLEHSRRIVRSAEGGSGDGGEHLAEEEREVQ